MFPFLQKLLKAGLWGSEGENRDVRVKANGPSVYLIVGQAFLHPYRKEQVRHSVLLIIFPGARFQVSVESRHGLDYL